jgi:hypothetical protein
MQDLAEVRNLFADAAYVGQKANRAVEAAVVLEASRAVVLLEYIGVDRAIEALRQAGEADLADRYASAQSRLQFLRSAFDQR